MCDKDAIISKYTVSQKVQLMCNLMRLEPKFTVFDTQYTVLPHLSCVITLPENTSTTKRVRCLPPMTLLTCASVCFTSI